MMTVMRGMMMMMVMAMSKTNNKIMLDVQNLTTFFTHTRIHEQTQIEVWENFFIVIAERGAKLNKTYQGDKYEVL